MTSSYRLPSQPFEDFTKSLIDSLRNIKNVIVVLSGKGGVGKSFIAASLAISFKLMGRDVAVLDADFHGPSIPWILGIEDRYPGVTIDGKIVPVDVEGISVISIELMLDDRKNPIIWRGPMKSKAILELISKTFWGSKDYLVVDLPPGTGDEPLTIAQYLRVKPIASILVLTPGAMVKHIVEKAKQFLNLLNIPFIGTVINMSYYRCPQCGTVTRILGSVDIDPREVLVEIPLDPQLSQVIERGTLLSFIKNNENETATMLRNLGRIVEDRLKNLNLRV
ncbi:MAG: Mrp/NBP35 family ATP-binding protein [Desulfurococcaceae archaeon]|jgi:ATP-binding protein involved in chromosome partitioning|nr:Mrp/NBP35 family ATP-binding protein [Desulfurococcaceae archaeon]